MDYDVLILGGGIIGCSVAYELSKYNFNIALIEKNYDVVDDEYSLNTSVIYDGSESKNSIMANLEKGGSKLIEEACSKFNVKYTKTGALRVGSTDEEIERVEYMYALSKKRGIDNVRLVDEDEIYKIEPNLQSGFKKGLYSENVAIMNPYDLAISYGEIATNNGVNFRFEEKVKKIEKVSKGFKVTTDKNKFKCRIVINTIIDDIYEEEENVNEDENFRHMNYVLVDENIKKPLNTVVVNDFSSKQFVISIPSIQGGSIIGIKNNETLEIQDRMEYSNKIVQGLEDKNINSIFCDKKNNLIIIDDTDIANGYISLTGSHYAKITLAPAIAKSIVDSIANNTKISLKKDFIDKRREFFKFRDMDNEERNEIIAVDKRYGNVICICNQVTEGEIVDSIRRPLGARTVEGVKKRTGAGLGGCYGTYCSRKIIKILAKEINKMPTEIVEDSKESKIWASRIKEFNEV